jgi:hypothetical protein
MSACAVEVIASAIAVAAKKSDSRCLRIASPSLLFWDRLLVGLVEPAILGANQNESQSPERAQSAPELCGLLRGPEGR